MVIVGNRSERLLNHSKLSHDMLPRIGLYANMDPLYIFWYRTCIYVVRTLLKMGVFFGTNTFTKVTGFASVNCKKVQPIFVV